MDGTDKKWPFQLYLWLLITLGVVALIFSGSQLDLRYLDGRFVLIAAITVGIGSRLNVKIPRVNAWVSISDAFIFLSFLLFGGEATLLLATLEAF